MTHWQSGMILTAERLGGAVCVMTTTATPSIPHASYTKVELTIASEDSGGMADVANGRLVCQRAGLYRIAAAVGFSVQAAGSRALVVNRNGAAARIGSAIPATPSGISPRLSASGLVRLVAGDRLEMFVWQNSGSAISLYNQFGATAFVEAERVSQ